MQLKMSPIQDQDACLSRNKYAVCYSSLVSAIVSCVKSGVELFDYRRLIYFFVKLK